MPHALPPTLLLTVCSMMVTPASALEPVRVAAGVYAFVGDTGPVSVANRGNTGNSGFIVGPSGVIVIDTGVSHRHGVRMLEAIRHVSDRPIELVILTRAVQDAVFGASAFDGATLAAHRETIGLMRARCQQCLEQLLPVLGAELHGTRLIIPERVLDGPGIIEAGGTSLQLLHYGWTSTPGDIALWHAETGVLFAGGLVSTDRVPEIRDCDFDRWRAALGELGKLPVVHVVPGHGPVSGKQSIDTTLNYLDALDRRVRTLYESNTSLLDALEQTDVAEFRNWGSYDNLHRRNALHRYLQLEIEDLGGDPRSVAYPLQ